MKQGKSLNEQIVLLQNVGVASHGSGAAGIVAHRGEGYTGLTWRKEGGSSDTLTGWIRPWSNLLPNRYQGQRCGSLRHQIQELTQRSPKIREVLVTCTQNSRISKDRWRRGRIYRRKKKHRQRTGSRNTWGEEKSLTRVDKENNALEIAKREVHFKMDSLRNTSRRNICGFWIAANVFTEIDESEKDCWCLSGQRQAIGGSVWRSQFSGAVEYEELKKASNFSRLRRQTE